MAGSALDALSRAPATLDADTATSCVQLAPSLPLPVSSSQAHASCARCPRVSTAYPSPPSAMPGARTTMKAKASVSSSESFAYSNFKVRDSATEAVLSRERSKRALKGKAKLKKQLHQAHDRSDLVQQLLEQGLVDKAVDVRHRHKWKAAFDKSEGRKVRDDETLIRKSLKKEAKAKAKSKKEWKERQRIVEAKMAKKQLKRVNHLQQQKHRKKQRKQDLLRKKGRILF